MEYVKQNRFWNMGYLKMCLSNILICTAVFLQFPLFRVWAEGKDFARSEVFLCVALFGVGMFISGPFNAWLVDAYKRKTVCYWAVAGLSLTGCALSSVEGLFLLSLVRIVEGACFGILQMALGSTLVNDLSISSKRTRTDSYFLWFSRMSLPAGMAAAWYLSERYTSGMVFLVPAGLFVAGGILLTMVRVPFHAPNRTPLFSLDRFWLPQAWLLVINLLPVVVVEGMLLGLPVPPPLVGMFAVGLLIAYVTHRSLFEEADCRADAVAGLLLIIAAMLLLMFEHEMRILYTAYTILGIGIGWVNSRLFLYFLKMSGHCQRGTLQQTYMLTSIAGICVGFTLSGAAINHLVVSMVLGILALALYLFFTHRWFLKKRDRNFKFREV